MANVEARDLEDLGSTVGEVLCTFLDIILHAMVPLVNDPYFGDLFIGFRLLISLFVWGALIIPAGYLVVWPCEMILKRYRRSATDNTDPRNVEQDKEEANQSLLDKLSWRSAKEISSQENENARRSSVGNGLVASIRALPRLEWNILRRGFLSRILCFRSAPETGENDIPYLPTATEENPTDDVVIPMGGRSQLNNNAVSPGTSAESQDFPKELKNLLNSIENNKIKIMGKELKLNNIPYIPCKIMNPEEPSATAGEAASGKPDYSDKGADGATPLAAPAPGRSVQITYNIFQIQDDKANFNDAE